VVAPALATDELGTTWQDYADEILDAVGSRTEEAVLRRTLPWSSPGRDRGLARSASSRRLPHAQHTGSGASEETVVVITRMWRGWARSDHADRYEQHYRSEVMATLRQVRGFGERGCCGGPSVRRPSLCP
jgi:hypothetical protein